MANLLVLFFPVYLTVYNMYSKQSSVWFVLEWESLSLPPVAPHVEIRYPKDKKWAFVGKCGLRDLPHYDRGDWTKKQELTQSSWIALSDYKLETVFLPSHYFSLSSPDIWVQQKTLELCRHHPCQAASLSEQPCALTKASVSFSASRGEQFHMEILSHSQSMSIMT